LREQPVDVVLADIRMPGMDGIELAGHIGGLAKPPAVIFTTAYDNYAVQAFDLNAVDYLLKPVRTQRLLVALQKVLAAQPLDGTALATIGRELRGGGRTHLSCHERGRLLLVPLAEVLYFKADLKYVTARTAEREYLLDEALTHLETEFADRFIRLHRAVLVAKSALKGFEKAGGDDAEAYGWALLRDVPEKLPVSRRQWTPAKALVSTS
jgi:two-component system response regulator AlgR